MVNGKQEYLLKIKNSEKLIFMKIYILTVVSLFTFIVTNAQSKLVQSLDRVNLNVFTTGINYSKEMPIANKSTIEGAVGISSTYYVDDFALQFRAGISVDYKFYYNIDRRNEKGKNIKGNSASFIGATAFSDLFPLNNLEQSSNENFLFGGAVFWGIRQQIKESGFQVNFLAGPSLAMKDFTGHNPSLYIRTGVSYIF